MVAPPSPAKSLAFEMREHDPQKGGGLTPLPYLVCLPLEQAGYVNAFSTRLGGVSPFPEDALHLSFKNDRPENVRENRRRFLKAAGFSQFTLVTAEQTHSADIHAVQEKDLDQIRNQDQTELPGDALITQLNNSLLAVKTADCLPLLIADPETGTFAAVHAGWRGTLNRLVEKTLEKMALDFGVAPENCLAAMGPAACGGCYEVGRDVIQPFKENFSYAEDLFSPASDPSKSFFDVRLANAMQLLTAGLSPMNIFGADECTMHENELFFSHRQEGKAPDSKVGRQLSVIGKK